MRDQLHTVVGHFSTQIFVSILSAVTNQKSSLFSQLSSNKKFDVLYAFCT